MEDQLRELCNRHGISTLGISAPTKRDAIKLALIKKMLSDDASFHLFEQSISCVWKKIEPIGIIYVFLETDIG